MKKEIIICDKCGAEDAPIVVWVPIHTQTDPAGGPAWMVAKDYDFCVRCAQSLISYMQRFREANSGGFVYDRYFEDEDDRNTLAIKSFLEKGKKAEKEH